MQGDDADVELVPAPEPLAPLGPPPTVADPGPSGLTPFGSSNLFSPPPNAAPPVAVPAPAPRPGSPAPRGGGRVRRLRSARASRRRRSRASPA